MPRPDDRVDLHLHTTASDGVLTPTQVVEEAQWHGVSAVAITDHDTIEGLAEAHAAGKKCGVEIIAGMELSCRYTNLEVHLIGLLLEPNPELAATLAKLRQSRETRMQKMLANLAKLGIQISPAELRLAPGQAAGRPHLARAMVRRGLVKTSGEAFERYLDDRGPVYVEREHLTISAGVKIIRRARGIVILAHPGVSKLNAYLDEICNVGMDGLESLYPKYSPTLQRFYAQYCAMNYLLTSGGSDFHHHERGAAEIGTPAVPYAFLTAIKQKKGLLWRDSLTN
jgi:predicted metal-dependent phosphoesterase TrpH